MTKIIRLFNTLRFMKVSQVFFFAWRRGLPSKKVYVKNRVKRRFGLALKPLLPVSTFRENQESFYWLNREQVVHDDRVDWAPLEQSRLWRYHLHYFDVLRDQDRSYQNKQSLVDDWIKNNPQGSEPAWEPYTASLRIVNWLAWFCSPESDELPEAWLMSAYEQALWLEQNDERHILANHYFENIKALLFAGAFFDGKDGDRWLVKGCRLLDAQLDEQFLDDGGHYERSPHYHALMLENLIDLLNLQVNNSSLFNAVLISKLEKVAAKALGVLQQLMLPGQRLPLFNDTSLDSAPKFTDLSDYAADVLAGGVAPETSSRLIDLPDTGVFGLCHRRDAVVIDCGDVGPDYQPGHTHCDFLSFEYVVDEKPVIVDSGLYEYQPGEMRDYVRRTSAHNTVAVDGHEQSEIWGAFRVARRAKRLSADVDFTDGVLTFTGAYTGFPALECQIEHHRRLSWEPESPSQTLFIEDSIKGCGTHLVESFLHFHPDLTLDIEATGSVVVKDGLEPRYKLSIVGDCQLSVGSGWYCPSFGERYKNQVLTISKMTQLPTEFGYRMETIHS